jgi:DNA mismatch repair protein MutL
VISQQLLIPEVISLAPKDYAVIMELADALAGAGIEVEPFGGDAVVVKSIPAMMGQAEPKGIVMDILDEFSESEKTASLRDKKERLFVALACKAAIKANHRLAAREVEALCRDLDETPYAATCPHGRPVYISLTTGELERMFKRR